MKKIIIDTDIGSDIDDTWALVYALVNPEFDVRLIIVSSEDTDYRAQIVAKILCRLGMTDIPIAKGLSSKAGEKPQISWLSDFDITEYRGVITEDFKTAVCTAVLEGAYNYIELGPFSTLNAIIESNEKLSDILHVTAMGGAVYQGYINQDKPQAECNIVLDTLSAARMFKRLSYLKLAPLDVCRDFLISGKDYRLIQSSQTRAARVIKENYAFWQRDYTGGALKYEIDNSSSILYDLIPFFLLERPEWFLMTGVGLSVTEDGRTVPDENCKSVLCALQFNKKAEAIEHTASLLISED